MTGLRKVLVVFAVLFGVLAMHGGIGSTGCGAMAMSTRTIPTTRSGVEGTSLALHLAPTVPASPTRTPHSDNCSAPLPPSAAALLISLVLLGTAVLPPRRLGARRLLLRPSGREPPRPRWLDPLTGLHVLRT